MSIYGTILRLRDCAQTARRGQRPLLSLNGFGLYSPFVPRRRLRRLEASPYIKRMTASANWEQLNVLALSNRRAKS